MAKNRKSNHPPDFSEIFAALDPIAIHAEALHIALDAFADGRTSQLSGSRVRDAVYQSLAAIDEALVRLGTMVEIGEEQTRGHITATLLASLQGAFKDFRGLNRVLYPIYSERAKHRISATQHSLLTTYLWRLEDDLARMSRSLGIPFPSDVDTDTSSSSPA